MIIKKYKGGYKMTGKQDTKVRSTTEIIPHIYYYFRKNNVRSVYTKEIFKYLENSLQLSDEEKNREFKVEDGYYKNSFENDCRGAKNNITNKNYKILKNKNDKGYKSGKWELKDSIWKDSDDKYLGWSRKKRGEFSELTKKVHEDILKIILQDTQ